MIETVAVLLLVSTAANAAMASMPDPPEESSGSDQT